MRFALAALGVLLLACSPRGGTAPGPSASASAPPAPLPPPTAPAIDAPASTDPLWVAAAGGDRAALERLAQREGALRLAEIAQGHPRFREPALQALPLTLDADLALGPLCRWVAAGSADPRRVLRALHDTAQALPLDRERGDVWGARGCLRVVRALQGSSGLSAADKDLAAATESTVLRWLDAR